MEFWSQMLAAVRELFLAQNSSYRMFFSNGEVCPPLIALIFSWLKCYYVNYNLWVEQIKELKNESFYKRFCHQNAAFVTIFSSLCLPFGRYLLERRLSWMGDDPGLIITGMELIDWSLTYHTCTLKAIYDCTRFLLEN